MKIYFEGSTDVEVTIQGDLYKITMNWQVEPVDNAPPIDLEVVNDRYQSYVNDLVGWTREHVHGKELTQQENLPRETHFPMDHSPTLSNLPAYLMEALIVRARPFGLELTQFSFRVDTGLHVLLVP